MLATKTSLNTLQHDRRRPGFTLIELLVATTILLILTTVTITMVNSTMKGDQIRSAARQVQSYVEGARDRAIHAKEPRGVRFLLDPTNTNTVTSLVFVGAPGTFSTGTFTIGRDWDTNGTFEDNQTIDPGAGFPLDEMAERGLVANGQPITINSNFYTLVKVPYPTATDPPVWRLTKAYAGMTSTSTAAVTAGPGGVSYTLQLNPAVLPNQEPRILPKGIMIDLPHSRLPLAWGTPGAYSPRMDVLFSPRGTVTGLVSSAGNIHLLLADVRDVERGLAAIDVDTNGNSTIDENERNVGDKLIVSITTQTGKITSHAVYQDLVSGSPDVFRFAELGKETQ